MNSITNLPISKETSVCIRTAGQILMISSALNLIYEVSWGARSILRLKPTISAVALGILGHDLHKVGCNLQEYYETKKFTQNITFQILGSLDAKELATILFKDTILERLYYDLASLVTQDFTMIKIQLI